MKEIFTALNDILCHNKDVEIVFPLHKNPKVREIAYASFGNNKQIHFCEPIGLSTV